MITGHENACKRNHGFWTVTLFQLVTLFFKYSSYTQELDIHAYNKSRKS